MNVREILEVARQLGKANPTNDTLHESLRRVEKLIASVSRAEFKGHQPEAGCAMDAAGHKGNG